MVTIQFQHTALFVHHDIGAHVVFPATGHNLTYFVNGQEKALSGHCSLTVNSNGGAVESAVGRAANRVPHLGAVVGSNVEVRELDDLLTAGTAQAVLWIPTGGLADLDPVGDDLGPYGDALWNIGGIKDAALTNCVQWTSGNGTVTLSTDTGSETLPDSETIIVTNTDHATPEFGKQNGDVTLPDFGLLYDLVKMPQGATKSLPQTKKVPPPGPAFSTLSNPASAPAPAPMPFTPLCPMAQL
jgi:hypothetical protein